MALGKKAANVVAELRSLANRIESGEITGVTRVGFILEAEDGNGWVFASHDGLRDTLKDVARQRKPKRK